MDAVAARARRAAGARGAALSRARPQLRRAKPRAAAHAAGGSGGVAPADELLATAPAARVDAAYRELFAATPSFDELDAMQREMDALLFGERARLLPPATPAAPSIRVGERPGRALLPAPSYGWEREERGERELYDAPGGRATGYLKTYTYESVRVYGGSQHTNGIATMSAPGAAAAVLAAAVAAAYAATCARLVANLDRTTLGSWGGGAGGLLARAAAVLLWPVLVFASPRFRLQFARAMAKGKSACASANAAGAVGDDLSGGTTGAARGGGDKCGPDEPPRGTQ